MDVMVALALMLRRGRGIRDWQLGRKKKMPETQSWATVACVAERPNMVTGRVL